MPQSRIIYHDGMSGIALSVGDHLRGWRQRRRLSQLDLAAEAEISARHLSFVETGRSMPSREMILHLAEQLQIPMRERNVLLVAAGFAPIFPERSLDDPALSAARDAIDLVLQDTGPIPRSRLIGAGISLDRTAHCQFCTTASPRS